MCGSGQPTIRVFSPTIPLAARDAAVIDAVINAAPRAAHGALHLDNYLDDLPCLSAEMLAWNFENR
jgi:hypothetical protein